MPAVRHVHALHLSYYSTSLIEYLIFFTYTIALT